MYVHQRTTLFLYTRRFLPDSTYCFLMAIAILQHIALRICGLNSFIAPADLKVSRSSGFLLQTRFDRSNEVWHRIVVSSQSSSRHKFNTSRVSRPPRHCPHCGNDMAKITEQAQEERRTRKGERRENALGSTCYTKICPRTRLPAARRGTISRIYRQ